MTTSKIQSHRSSAHMEVRDLSETLGYVTTVTAIPIEKGSRGTQYSEVSSTSDSPIGKSVGWLHICVQEGIGTKHCHTLLRGFDSLPSLCRNEVLRHEVRSASSGKPFAVNKNGESKNHNGS